MLNAVRLLCLVFVAALLLPLPCLSDDATPGSLPIDLGAVIQSIGKQPITLPQPKLVVPQSPAFAVLGISPSDIIIPATPNELVAGFAKGFDWNGNLQNGVALSFVPYLLSTPVDLDKYRSDSMVRLLSRTQVSLATAQGESTEDESIRLAGGVNITIFDKGDYRLDRELDRAWQRAVEATYPGPAATPPYPATGKDYDVWTTQIELRKQEWQKNIEAVYGEARKEAQARNWNGSSWVVGAATCWITPDGNSRHLHHERGGFWTTYAQRMGKSAQFLLFGRAFQNEQVPVVGQQNVFFSQDSTAWGPGVRVGGKNLRGVVEYLMVSAQPDNQPRDHYSQLNTGLEMRIAEGQWLQVSYTSQSGRSTGGDNSINASFNWGFGPKPTLEFPPLTH